MAVFASNAFAATTTVTPSANLPTQATVNVSGTGFAANEPGKTYQCTSDLTCTVPLETFATEAGGTFGPVQVTVTRTFIPDPIGVPIDCAVVAGGCFVLAKLDNVPGEDAHPISFGAAPQPPTIAPGPLPTGQRAAALKKCAKKKPKAKKKKCKKRARALPV